MHDHMLEQLLKQMLSGAAAEADAIRSSSWSRCYQEQQLKQVKLTWPLVRAAHTTQKAVIHRSDEPSPLTPPKEWMIFPHKSLKSSSLPPKKYIFWNRTALLQCFAISSILCSWCIAQQYIHVYIKYWYTSTIVTWMAGQSEDERLLLSLQLCKFTYSKQTGDGFLG